MNRIQIVGLWVSTLALLLGSCGGDDPISKKEAMLAQTTKTTISEKTSESTEVFTISFDSGWGDKGGYTLPLLTAQEDLAHTFWASASNHGRVLLGGDPFPVIPLEQGYRGKGIELRSIEGVYLPFLSRGSAVIAGTLFSGQLDATKLLSDKPYTASLIGQSWNYIPQTLILYYRYKAGASLVNQQGDKVSQPSMDTGFVTASFYEVTDPTTEGYLNGNTIMQTSAPNNVISRASSELSDTSGEEWVKLTLQFQTLNTERYQAIDFATKKYRLALLLTSSMQGANYIAAKGSSLQVDEITINSLKK